MESKESKKYEHNKLLMSLHCKNAGKIVHSFNCVIYILEEKKTGLLYFHCLGKKRAKIIRGNLNRNRFLFKLLDLPEKSMK